MDYFTTVGDKIFIGGLYGDSFKGINQKSGIIKKISCIPSTDSVNYIAEVQIDKIIIPISLRHVFKIKPVIDNILLSDNILVDLFTQLDLKAFSFGVDNNKQHVIVCRDKQNKSTIIDTSTLN